MTRPRGTTLIRVRQTDKDKLEKLRRTGQSVGDVVADAIKALFFARMNDAYAHINSERDEAQLDQALEHGSDPELL